MKADILSQLNKQNTLDNMIPLTEFSDPAKAQELEKQGYISGFTVESWKKEFPDIDPNKILCPQSLLFPASLTYYDPEHYICFDTHIFGGQMLFPSSKSGDGNHVLLNRIADGMKDYEERKYTKLLLPVTSEECGGIAIRLLRDMLEREEPNPDLYSAFLTVYTFCNCGAHHLGEKALLRLSMCKSEKQKAETEKKMEQFPGNTVTVYRGQASESTPVEKACSWTTDVNKAFFFASWRNADDSSILMGTVKKEDVLDFIDDRGEKEVLVQPGTVKITRERKCVSWGTFQNIAAADMFSKTYSFPEDSLARNIMSTLDEVYADAGEEDHDKNHSLRVALMANFIYRVSVLLPLTHGKKESFQTASHYLSDLSWAIIYHDAGRTDNIENPKHGAAGYEKYRKDHGENKTIQFLTTFHCRSDEEARAFWESNFEGSDAKYVWKAFCVLKDADALDRVRFGNRSRDYLDVTTLRTETAKNLVPVAHRLFSAKIR